MLTEAVQGTDYFSRIFSDGSYRRVPLEIWVELKSQQGLKGRGLIEETSVHRDW